jgi:hypothetical protein
MYSEEILTKEIKDLELKIDQDSDKLIKLKEKLFRDFGIPGIKSKYLHTYWKYPNNCYSCPETENDYWDEFYYVYDVDDNGKILFINFSNDKNGKTEIETKIGDIDYFSYKITQITKEEFTSNWDQLLLRIDNIIGILP